MKPSGYHILLYLKSDRSSEGIPFHVFNNQAKIVLSDFLNDPRQHEQVNFMKTFPALYAW